MADETTDPPGRRRSFSNAAMLLGLAGSYGLFGWTALRFLFPAKPQRQSWLFVTEVASLGTGQSLRFRTPAGALVNVTRQGDAGEVDDFIALSSTCPHLGCQVHWESANNRYFCPCHNGTFDAGGKGTGGPPGEAGQSLPRYPLKVENGLLFLEAPVESLTADNRGEVIESIDGGQGPGHDPCLARLRPAEDRKSPDRSGGSRA